MSLFGLQRSTATVMLPNCFVTLSQCDFEKYEQEAGKKKGTKRETKGQSNAANAKWIH